MYVCSTYPKLVLALRAPREFCAQHFFSGFSFSSSFRLDIACAFSLCLCVWRCCFCVFVSSLRYCCQRVTSLVILNSASSSSSSCLSSSPTQSNTGFLLAANNIGRNLSLTTRSTQSYRHPTRTSRSTRSTALAFEWIALVNS